MQYVAKVAPSEKQIHEDYMVSPDVCLISFVDIGFPWSFVDRPTISISSNTEEDKLWFSDCWTDEDAKQIQRTRK